MSAMPFTATIEHLAAQMLEQRVALAAEWHEHLDRMLPIDANEVFPAPTLLDHIPELIAQIAMYVQAPEAQAIEANAAIMHKATELGLLRFDQRAPVGQLLREYHVFSEILDRFFALETSALGPSCDATAAVLAAARTQSAVRALQQRTVDVLVASYTDRIRRKTAQLRNFSHLVSHEIRQPLGVLQVLARVLRRPVDAEESLRMVEALDRNVIRLADVANTLERMARLTRPAEQDSRAGHVDVEAVAHDLVAQFADEAEANAVTMEVGDHLPVLEADAGRVELVLANLLSNALKYRDPSKPARVVRIVAAEVSPNLGLCVEDNGLGIPAAKLALIFDHFTRVHEHLDDDLGNQGLGLGLAIVRESMETMGGRVTVESVEGAGTTFTLEWPSSGPPPPLPL